MKSTVERILDIEREQKRRRQQPLTNYNKDKVHPKQMMFHKCQAGNRWVFGGNRSGKTECGAVETVWLSRGIHPYRPNRPDTVCFVVSLSSQVSREVAQQKILYYLDKQYIADIVMVSGRRDSAEYGIVDYILVKNVYGGLSKIFFKSCEAGREKFQGVSLDFVWFDEEPPLDIYSECKMRLLDRKGFIYGTMTPLKGLTWVYEQIFLNAQQDDEVWHITMEWADNPYLPQDEVQHYTQTMSTEELKSRRYGEFYSQSGLVYSEFDSTVHVIQPFEVPHEWYDNISIDPGLNNPLSCHWYAVDSDGVVYVIAEHYEAKQSVSYHARKIEHMCNQLGWHRDSSGRISALIDSASNQRTLASSKSVAELFYEQNIAVNTRVNKDLFSGINRVKAYLKPEVGQPRLYIFSCCVNLIREFKSYWWGNEDRPKKVDDHALDELRYYLSSRPEAHVPLNPPKSVITLDKENLLRKHRRVHKQS
ncbi:MAG: terminase family protein [Clostridia bacterium]|nr:terminase family protein [Clostridia bacterium]